jgi:tetratricopeptide (TPR) repeat protein
MSPPTKDASPLNGQPRLIFVVCLVLAAITFVVFGQTITHEFVAYDDPQYVFGNRMVQQGLTMKGFLWALTYGEIGHWHPLTWLTHMADCQVYGTWPGGHHLTNVLLHAGAVVLLFLALREMTGSLWRSASVAAVFAVHPLRAESVAWVAERKDVLSGVFFMLTLWAYARYARQPAGRRYAAVVAAYALGLLSKNMLVTLPFVLLLLDWWPLHRGLGWGLVKEKIPLFLLSAASCWATFLVPEKTFDPYGVPLLGRIANAVVSYGIYLRQTVYPAGLAIPYLNPPNGLPAWKVALAFLLLAAISMGVVQCRKSRPYLLVGWLWYLGMLVPAIGLIPISYYAHADRYTYLPSIGLALALTWAAADWSAGWKHREETLGVGMAVLLAALMICGWKQTACWRDGTALWKHALACGLDNEVVHDGLGNALLKDDQVDQAIAQYQLALRINPRFELPHFKLGSALLLKGRVDEAIAQFRQTLRTYPNRGEVHTALGIALLRKGKAEEAAGQFRTALQCDAGDVVAHCKLGDILLQQGRVNDAIAQYQQALQADPGDAKVHYNLANILLEHGRVDEAITHYQRALQINPAYAQAHANLGSALLQEGKADEAIAQYRRALQIDPNCAQARANLASIQPQKGRAEEKPAPQAK